ncbi:NAC domain-containing protein 18-like [Camellia sinensis]|uniref:NAC domain-containing protein 18-like n=1 Tax=Camellia sinensis TaxID=4442 RepID=UPI001036DF76|nr:NAC domain-containing protein 18-like [Camellia sinensis]
MHEYKLHKEIDMKLGDWVLCKIYYNDRHRQHPDSDHHQEQQGGEQSGEVIRNEGLANAEQDHQQRPPFPFSEIMYDDNNQNHQHQGGEVIRREGLANAEQDHQQWPPLRSCGIMYNNIYVHHGMPSSSDCAFGFDGAH